MDSPLIKKKASTSRNLKAESVVVLIGITPLIIITNMTYSLILDVEVYEKAVWFNTGGSVMD
ncbi:MAG: cysteine synthase, partial [Thermodesulfobacteriota bacterium]